MASAQLPVTLIVLAAGKSIRMGDKNKLLLPLKGKPLLEYILERLKPVPVFEKLVVINPADKRIRSLIDPHFYRLVLNPDYEEGIASSIRYGVWASKDTAQGYLFYLADMPLISLQTIHELLMKFDSMHPRRILIPSFKGKRGNPVLVGRAYRRHLLTLQGDKGARQIFKEAQEHIQEIQVGDPAILWDIDTESAYEEILRKMEGD